MVLQTGLALSGTLYSRLLFFYRFLSVSLCASVPPWFKNGTTEAQGHRGTRREIFQIYLTVYLRAVNESRISINSFSCIVYSGGAGASCALASLLLRMLLIPF